MRGLTRRALLAGTAAVAACVDRAPAFEGGFAGATAERGHVLREPRRSAEPDSVRRTQVVIAGGGIAGLAAARALRQRGIEDFALLELEDEPGGNSRGGVLGGIAHPLGAHYLPVPSDAAPEVQDLLEELGLRRREAGRWRYDERHLCHSPQERVFFEGQWQDGLLPMHGVSAATLEQYRRFSARVEQAQRDAAFAIPAALRARSPQHLALDRVTLGAWLDAQGLTDPHLRWYLDYCCRDDYGAGIGAVSAWAGIHYFAARHGFHLPGEGEASDAVLTWPEGNAWLARALAAPLKDRVQHGCTVLRIAETRDGVEVDALHTASGRMQRWLARHCVVGLPVFIAARVVEKPPEALRLRAAGTRTAPWTVVNMHLASPLRESPGAALAWDNVVYGAQGLGYVVATHQSLDPRPGPTVLTWYCAPGEAARSDLLRQPWTHWRDRALAELAGPHPDLPGRITRMSVARYGHAMAVPVPGTLALPAPPRAAGRLSFAHSDWAGYSIFEEAFTLGHHAGRAA